MQYGRDYGRRYGPLKISNATLVDRHSSDECNCRYSSLIIYFESKKDVELLEPGAGGTASPTVMGGKLAMTSADSSVDKLSS